MFNLYEIIKSNLTNDTLFNYINLIIFIYFKEIEVVSNKKTLRYNNVTK